MIGNSKFLTISGFVALAAMMAPVGLFAQDSDPKPNRFKKIEKECGFKASAVKPMPKGRVLPFPYAVRANIQRIQLLHKANGENHNGVRVHFKVEVEPRYRVPFGPFRPNVGADDGDNGLQRRIFPYVQGKLVGQLRLKYKPVPGVYGVFHDPEVDLCLPLGDSIVPQGSSGVLSWKGTRQYYKDFYFGHKNGQVMQHAPEGSYSASLRIAIQSPNQGYYRPDGRPNSFRSRSYRVRPRIDRSVITTMEAIQNGFKLPIRNIGARPLDKARIAISAPGQKVAVVDTGKSLGRNEVYVLKHSFPTPFQGGEVTVHLREALPAPAAGKNYHRFKFKVAGADPEPECPEEEMVDGKCPEPEPEPEKVYDLSIADAKAEVVERQEFQDGTGFWKVELSARLSNEGTKAYLINKDPVKLIRWAYQPFLRPGIADPPAVPRSLKPGEEIEISQTFYSVADTFEVNGRVWLAEAQIQPDKGDDPTVSLPDPNDDNDSLSFTLKVSEEDPEPEPVEPPKPPVLRVVGQSAEVTPPRAIGSSDFGTLRFQFQVKNAGGPTDGGIRLQVCPQGSYNYSFSEDLSEGFKPDGCYYAELPDLAEDEKSTAYAFAVKLPPDAWPSGDEGVGPMMRFLATYKVKSTVNADDQKPVEVHGRHMFKHQIKESLPTPGLSIETVLWGPTEDPTKMKNLYGVDDCEKGDCPVYTYIESEPGKPTYIWLRVRNTTPKPINLQTLEAMINFQVSPSEQAPGTNYPWVFDPVQAFLPDHIVSEPQGGPQEIVEPGQHRDVMFKYQMDCRQLQAAHYAKSWEGTPAYSTRLVPMRARLEVALHAGSKKIGQDQWFGSRFSFVKTVQDTQRMTYRDIEQVCSNGNGGVPGTAESTDK